MNLTQYKLIRGKNIKINGINYGEKADVSKMCGEFIVEGEISSKHNHTLESAIVLVEKLTEIKQEAIDNFTIELLESGVL